jgi:hypothetical protein
MVMARAGFVVKIDAEGKPFTVEEVRAYLVHIPQPKKRPEWMGGEVKQEDYQALSSRSLEQFEALVAKYRLTPEQTMRKGDSEASGELIRLANRHNWAAGDLIRAAAGDFVFI